MLALKLFHRIIPESFQARALCQLYRVSIKGLGDHGISRHVLTRAHQAPRSVSVEEIQKIREDFGCPAFVAIVVVLDVPSA
jgi:hypothetical protein